MMSSPAKKRKLNKGGNKLAATQQSKGLEYFFSKQKQQDVAEASSTADETICDGPVTLTDEELARKLQAEWNQEVRNNKQQEWADERVDCRTFYHQSTPNSESEEAIRTCHVTSTPSHHDSAEERGSLSTLTLQSPAISEDYVTSSIPFDESPLTFEPSRYVVQLQEHWKVEGGDASYALLTRCFVLVSSTTSRIKIVDTLVNCLRVLIEGDPSSLLPAVSRPFDRVSSCC